MLIVCAEVALVEAELVGGLLGVSVVSGGVGAVGACSGAGAALLGRGIGCCGRGGRGVGAARGRTCCCRISAFRAGRTRCR